MGIKIRTAAISSAYPKLANRQIHNNSINSSVSFCNGNAISNFKDEEFVRIFITDVNTPNTPKASGGKMRVMTGLISKLITCPSALPPKRIKTLLKKLFFEGLKIFLNRTTMSIKILHNQPLYKKLKCEINFITSHLLKLYLNKLW